MADTITAVGSAIKSAGSAGATTVSITPTALGNAFFMATEIGSTTVTISSVSGGGCTWQRIATPYVAGYPYTEDIWLGTVTGSVGSASTVTVTGSSSLASIAVLLTLQQLTTGGGAGTTWAPDGSSGTPLSNASSTSVTYPTLTPSGAARAYIGMSVVQNTGSATGQTSGYTVVLDTNSNPVIYNLNVAASAQSPAAAQAPAGTSFTIGALITGTNPVTATATGAFFPFFG